jgi:hypothetical protein
VYVDRLSQIIEFFRTLFLVVYVVVLSMVFLF